MSFPLRAYSGFHGKDVSPEAGTRDVFGPILPLEIGNKSIFPSHSGKKFVVSEKPARITCFIDFRVNDLDAQPIGIPRDEGGSVDEHVFVSDVAYLFHQIIWFLQVLQDTGEQDDIRSFFFLRFLHGPVETNMFVFEFFFPDFDKFFLLHDAPSEVFHVIQKFPVLIITTPEATSEIRKTQQVPVSGRDPEEACQ
jgi:hypothetical protein